MNRNVLTWYLIVGEEPLFSHSVNVSVMLGECFLYDKLPVENRKEGGAEAICASVDNFTIICVCR